MGVKEALELLAAVGKGSTATAAEFATARGALIAAAKEAKANADKAGFATLLESVRAIDKFAEEAAAAEAASQAELDKLAADFPEFAADDAAAEAGAAGADEPGAAGADAPVAVGMLSARELAERYGAELDSDKGDQVVETPEQTLTILGERQDGASWSDLGNAFAKHSKSSLRDGKTTLATFKVEHSTHLTGRTGENTRALDSLTRAAQEPAIVAAGGCCTLAEPIRSQPMLASLARPIADSLPTVGSSAGSVTFFPPVCLPQGGVGVWTCEHEEALDPNDPTTWKKCTEVECADADTIVLSAIYQCLTIGNFNQRFNAERWDAILHATAAAQARLAEQTLFKQISDSSYTTKHTFADTGSIYLTMLNAITRAAAAMSQRQRYAPRIKVIAAEWLKDAAAMDIEARAVKRGRPNQTDSIEVALAAKGIDVTWSPDIDPIEADPTGTLAELPAKASIVMYVDGGVFRLDGGELNLGTEIRDHDLNRQNKVATFAETFEHAVVRSCETKLIELPVSICDEAPCSVAPAPIQPGPGEG